ncbi:MAG: SDR family NAD(P)-dependent oxidoreductase [Bacteroidetes bacterium]|jgi:NAD(P)-dependent dehydrogenase (short-subunit alcohol dehydrogenase family)|nr:SDR family NAD(P)-dependent oxidoreductase [Bacteroidota bacterium]
MTILVTGASSGLGQAVARQLSRDGHKVFGTSRQERRVESGVDMLKMDLSDNDSIQQAIEHIRRNAGSLDAVVNNAGIGIAGPMEEIDQAALQRTFDINTIGTVRVWQAVLPLMRQQGHGKILNISSIGARVGLPFRGAYCASKASIDLMTEALRMEVKPYGIQVCCIHAGDIRTNINDNRVQSYRKDGPYRDRYERVYQRINQEVKEGVSPQFVAAHIAKLLQNDQLKPYYAIGKPLQRLSLLLKKVLPARLFERLISNYANA